MTQSLQQALENQVENLSQLAGQLDQELHLIGSRDAEALMTLLKDKEQTLEKIQQGDKQVNTLMASQGDAMPDELQSLIDQSRALLEQCQYQTQINQRAVEQGQLRLTHLRNIMLEVRAKESLTYDKSGKAKAGPLGKGVSA